MSDSSATTQTKSDASAADWLQRIVEANNRVGRARRALADAKAKATEAKNFLEQMQAELEAIIAESQEPEQGRFDFESHSDDPEAWRFEPIERLKLAPRLLKAFKDNQLDTLGEATTWLEAKLGRTWQDLNGVGTAGAEAIDMAWELYWAERKAATEKEDE